MPGARCGRNPGGGSQPNLRLRDRRLAPSPQGPPMATTGRGRALRFGPRTIRADAGRSACGLPRRRRGKRCPPRLRLPASAISVLETLNMYSDERPALSPIVWERAPWSVKCSVVSAGSRACPSSLRSSTPAGSTPQLSYLWIHSVRNGSAMRYSPRPSLFTSSPRSSAFSAAWTVGVAGRECRRW
jgi:hypothetical protein